MHNTRNELWVPNLMRAWLGSGFFPSVGMRKSLLAVDEELEVDGEVGDLSNHVIEDDHDISKYFLTIPLQGVTVPVQRVLDILREGESEVIRHFESYYTWLYTTLRPVLDEILALNTAKFRSINVFNAVKDGVLEAAEAAFQRKRTYALTKYKSQSYFERYSKQRKTADFVLSEQAMCQLRSFLEAADTVVTQRLNVLKLTGTTD